MENASNRIRLKYQIYSLICGRLLLSGAFLFFPGFHVHELVKYGIHFLFIKQYIRKGISNILEWEAPCIPLDWHTDLENEGRRFEKNKSV